MEQEMRKLGLKKNISKAALDKLNTSEEFLNKEKAYSPIIETENDEKPPKPKSYARRMSTLGLVSTNADPDEFSNVKKIRKYSLDNDLVGKPAKSLSSASMVKSIRRLSKADLKSASNGKLSPSLFTPSVSIKTDMSDLCSTSLVMQTRSNTMSRNQTTSAFSRNRSSISTYSSALNLPKLSRLSLSHAASSTSMRKLVRNKENSSSTSNKRRVSFGQIDLNNLDNPKLYRYSNSAAYERYKFNPHYYLPDGSLKRKFSLPKLSDTLEAVKNCNYLRRNSIENTADQTEILNIFKENAKALNSATSTSTPTRELNYNSVIISSYE